MEWHFDKDTVKLLRYIYFRKGVTEKQILKKFGEDSGVGFTLINLSIDSYLTAEDESGKPFAYKVRNDDTPHASFDSTRWYTTAKSNLVVQSDCANLWKWLVPLIVSLVSLALSGTNFFLNWRSNCP